jgi:hypothetical protein
VPTRRDRSAAQIEFHRPPSAIVPAEFGRPAKSTAEPGQLPRLIRGAIPSPSLSPLSCDFSPDHLMSEVLMTWAVPSEISPADEYSFNFAGTTGASPARYAPGMPRPQDQWGSTRLAWGDLQLEEPVRRRPPLDRTQALVEARQVHVVVASSPCSCASCRSPPIRTGARSADRSCTASRPR